MVISMTDDADPHGSRRSGRIAPFEAMDEAEIAARLKRHHRLHGTDPALEFPDLPQMTPAPPKPAAVLIPLLRSSGEWLALLTRRNSRLPEHSGQVSFPGGRVDPTDRSVEDTALREAHEEIGLHPQDVHLIGRLREYRTITNYLVTPIVGTLPWPYPLKPAADEVSRVFTIPLTWMADSRNHEERQRELPSPFGPAKVIFFQPYDGEVLWGASARIMLDLLLALTDPA